MQYTGWTQTHSSANNVELNVQRIRWLLEFLNGVKKAKQRHPDNSIVDRLARGHRDPTYTVTGTVAHVPGVSETISYPFVEHWWCGFH